MHDNLVKLEQLTEKLNEKDREIRSQKETYESLVELLPEIVIVHKNTEILFINTYGMKVLGFKNKNDIIGRSIYDFIMNDDKPKVRAMLQVVGGVCRQEDFIEVELIKNNNKIMLGEAGASKVSWKGTSAIQTVIRDVTHFKRLENRLLSLEFEKGKVNGIYLSPNKSYLLAEGWYTKLVEEEVEYDVYEVQAYRGKDLKEHSHKQKEIIEIIKGEIIVFLEGETKILKSGDKLEIKPFEKHKFTALKDSKLRVTFAPPLSIKKDK